MDYGAPLRPFWTREKVQHIALNVPDLIPNHDSRSSIYFELPGLLMATKLPFMAILSHFGALWRPSMAILDAGKGPNPSPRMCHNLIQT